MILFIQEEEFGFKFSSLKFLYIYIYIYKIQPLNYMFYMFLTYMPIFISIGCYLPFDL